MANGWQGLALPIHFENGQFAISSAIIEDNVFSKIDESIYSIVTASEYENPMTGIGVPKLLLFKSFNSDMIPYYQSVIKERVNLFEPRVRCDRVIIDRDLTENQQRNVTVEYILLGSNVPSITTFAVNSN